MAKQAPTAAASSIAPLREPDLLPVGLLAVKSATPKSDAHTIGVSVNAQAAVAAARWNVSTKPGRRAARRYSARSRYRIMLGMRPTQAAVMTAALSQASGQTHMMTACSRCTDKRTRPDTSSASTSSRIAAAMASVAATVQQRLQRVRHRARALASSAIRRIASDEACSDAAGHWADRHSTAGGAGASLVPAAVAVAYVVPLHVRGAVLCRCW